MKNALLIAEKPDLMRKIENVYRTNRTKIPYQITFTSQRGHLVTLMSPTEMDDDLKQWTWENLPIEPEDYGGWQYKLIHEEKKGKFLTSEERYYEIKKEIDSGKYDFVIHAGDPDQEGELLVRIVLSYANNILPVKRFWTNDLTETHILKALQNLKDDDNDDMLTNLLDAAYARQHSDWRFGMNISRAATLKMGTRISCGRVKTPILAIICKREEEIRNFKPSTTYGVKAFYEEGFDGTLFDKTNMKSADPNASDDQKMGIVWFDTKEEAQDLIDQLENEATVKAYSSKRSESYAPKLYKLASAQIDAGKMGYNDATTLEVIQKLYEKEYLSYPRTDCEYLSSDEDFEGILEELATLDDFAEYCNSIQDDDITRVRSSKRWINDKALKEAGHSALRPTTIVPDMDDLSKAEQDIYSMIVKRFIAIFLPPLVQNKTMLITDVDGHTFQSTGKTLVNPGYSTIFGTTFTDTEIPVHKKGDVLDVEAFQLMERTTTCPKRFTSPDMISVCENPIKYLNDESLKVLGKRLKIGTPATRSGIIRQLIDKDKYIEEKKEKRTTYLYPTELGEGIIRNLSGLQICRVDMTGAWEEQLELIRNGEKPLSELEHEMRMSVRDMLHEIKEKDMEKLSSGKMHKVIGKCPKCGKDVIETEKGILCTGYRDGCKIGVFKSSFGQTFDYDDFVELASGNQVTKESRIFYYDFSKNKVMEQSEETDIPCPSCSNYMKETQTRYLCTDCGFSTSKVIASHELTEEELKQLGEDSQTEEIDDFVSKKGNPFSAQLVLNDNKLEFRFKESSSMPTNFTCPCCKKEKLKEYEKKYSCSCGFQIWKTICGRELDEEDIEQLCEERKTDMLEGFVSKKGKEFSCYLAVNKRKQNVEMKFE